MSGKQQPLDGLIALPKGGGALAGMGGTFQPDLHTGTGNLSIPLEIPGGRNGLQPSLTLAYSSGNGNGSFGLGWSLGLASISRLTTRGVPRYGASDIFVLAGTEELAPLAAAVPGTTRYRPLTEGAFARIERHDDIEGDHWTVATRDGLVSRHDPLVRNPDRPEQIFAWLIGETLDPFGNRIAYRYRDDDGLGGAQRHIREIAYVDLPDRGPDAFLVTITFLYDDDAPPSGVTASVPARARPDRLSGCRAGFEVATARRCKWIVVSTHADPAIAKPVRAYELVYRDEIEAGDEATSLLVRIGEIGFDDDGIGHREAPPIEFAYTRFEPARRRFSTLQGPAIPAVSLAAPGTELVDLFGNGLPDIVEMSGIGACYWRNRGGCRFDAPRDFPFVPGEWRSPATRLQLLDANGDGRADLLVTGEHGAGYWPLTFAGAFDRRSWQPYRVAPGFSLDDPEVRLIDLTGDGVTDVLRTGTEFECFFNDPVEGWTAERTARLRRGRAADFPDVSFADPRVRLADMQGDGLTDIVRVESRRIDYWPSLGHGRFGARQTLEIPEGLPADIDPDRVLLGDIDGDGVADLILVGDRSVTLWRNLSGHAFAKPIVIAGTPPLSDAIEVRLVDLEGSGVAGLLWTGDGSIDARPRHYFLDFTGGSKPDLLTRIDTNLGATTEISYAPSTRFYLEDESDPATRWRSCLPFPVQVVERTVVTDSYSRGARASEYRYHHGCWDGDRREFRGFGMVEQLDSEVFSAYRGRGHADDPAALAELLAGERYAPPMLSRTWFHLGPVDPPGGGNWQELDLTDEFWTGDRAVGQLRYMPDDGSMAIDCLTGIAATLATLAVAERRTALRAMRGSVLRSESYALDGAATQLIPWSVSEHAYALISVDRTEDGAAIVAVRPTAQRTTQWERGDDPLTRYVFTSDYDAHGQPRRKLDVACPRGWRIWDDRPQEAFLATLTQTRFADAPGGGPFLTDRVSRVRSFDMSAGGGISIGDLLSQPESQDFDPRLLSEAITYFDGAPFEGLGFGQLGAFGMPARSETLVFTDTLLAAIYGPEGTPLLEPASLPAHYPEAFHAALPAGAGYRKLAPDAAHAGGWYAESGASAFDFHYAARDERCFGLAVGQRDALGHITTIAAQDYQFALLPTRVTGPTGLVIRGEYDQRLLKLNRNRDANGHGTELRFSPSGRVVAAFARGREGEGDIDLPSVRFEYDFLAHVEHGEPISVRTVNRHIHDSDAAGSGATSELREYSDGFGRLLQTRAQAAAVRFDEPLNQAGQLAPSAAHIVGEENLSPDAPNVVVSGWRVYDSKGRVIRSYEPFFDRGWNYAEPGAAQLGQSVAIHHDAAGRAIRTVNPDRSEVLTVPGIPHDMSDPPLAAREVEKYRPSPWESYTYDANDNAERTHPGRGGDYRHHFDTPVSTLVDALGRSIKLTLRHRGPADATGRAPPIEQLVTRSEFDIQGRVLAMIDALGRRAMAYRYDLTGRECSVRSIDGGESRLFSDAAGNAIEQRDAKGAISLSSYDALNRPSRRWACDAADKPITLRERMTYGEDPAYTGTTANALGRLVEHDDEAGCNTIGAYDFKGSVTESLRRIFDDTFLLAPYRAELARPEAERDWTLATPRIDWADPATAAALSAPYLTRSSHDALGRVVWSDYPAAANGETYRLQPRYDAAGALEGVTLVGPIDAMGNGPVQSFVDRITYNARGQRTLIAYENGLVSRYAYDRATFRLARLRTERGALTPGTTPACTFTGAPLQDLTYDYDLAGNLLRLTDATPGSGVAGNPDAMVQEGALRQALIFGNALIRRFAYDPLYRLVSATGRETMGIATPRPWDDVPRGGYGVADQRNAANLTQLYREDYEYDLGNNMLTLRHGPGAAGGWSRRFGVGGRTPDEWRADATAHASGDWVDAPSNRLTHVSDGDGAHAAQTHWYDPCGNLIREQEARFFSWDHADRLKTFRAQAGNGQPSVYALYLYDAAGTRLKKLVVDDAGRCRTTTYIGNAFEHHTEQRMDGTRRVENCSLHVLDDVHRIAMVRAGPAFADDGAADHPVQFHLADHLGSAAVVTSFNGDWINREEYFPYGETSFGGFARKRYRFTGKQRDEESGLNLHGHRYLTSALCRWISCDPAGPVDGPNLYLYARASPLRFSDRSGLAGDESGVPSDGGVGNMTAGPAQSYSGADRQGGQLSGGVRDVPVDSTNAKTPEPEPRLLNDHKLQVCHVQDENNPYYDNSVPAERARYQKQLTERHNEYRRRTGPQVGATPIMTALNDPFIHELKRTGSLDSIVEYGLMPAFQAKVLGMLSKIGRPATAVIDTELAAMDEAAQRLVVVGHQQCSGYACITMQVVENDKGRRSLFGVVTGNDRMAGALLEEGDMIAQAIKDSARKMGFRARIEIGGHIPAQHSEGIHRMFLKPSGGPYTPLSPAYTNMVGCSPVCLLNQQAINAIVIPGLRRGP